MRGKGTQNQDKATVISGAATSHRKDDDSKKIHSETTTINGVKQMGKDDFPKIQSINTYSFSVRIKVDIVEMKQITTKKWAKCGH